MEFTLICNILLFIGCYKLFGNWEVPVELGFNPFEVSGGFPTLIESFFEEFNGKSAENSRNPNFPLEDVSNPISKSGSARILNWTCPILESQNECFSVVTSSECLATSQFSHTFWDSSDTFRECFHRSKKDAECKTPFQRGNSCENVVVGIQKNGNSTFFELDDFQIGTQIVQVFNEKLVETWHSENLTEIREDSCQNYEIHELVLAGSENNTEYVSLFPFGVNTTHVGQRSAVSPCQPPFPTEIFLCNCKNEPDCSIPVIYSGANATFCGSTSISIYHSHGFIYSVVVTSSEDDVVATSSLQTHSVSFFDLPQTAPRSSFSLKRGRFQCPSETSCFLEILYPFSFLNSLEFPFQIGILCFSLILGNFILKNQ